MAEAPLYVYTCSAGEGHELSAPQPITRCYGMKDGKPCPGTLKQVAGPRKATAAPEKVSVASAPPAPDGDKNVQAYLDGASLAQVAILLQMPVTEARAFLISKGVTIRGRGRPAKR